MQGGSGATGPYTGRARGCRPVGVVHNRRFRKRTTSGINRRNTRHQTRVNNARSGTYRRERRWPWGAATKAPPKEELDRYRASSHPHSIANYKTNPIFVEALPSDGGPYWRSAENEALRITGPCRKRRPMYTRAMQRVRIAIQYYQCIVRVRRAAAQSSSASSEDLRILESSP